MSPSTISLDFLALVTLLNERSRLEIATQNTIYLELGIELDMWEILRQVFFSHMYMYMYM